ncbi:MAG: response regulator transcription factor [Lachnospiraceae bacterium]
MSKILMIDDDKELCALVKKYAEQEQYNVKISYTGSAGLREVQNDTYQLIILDVMLPEINGFSVLSEIRKISNVPVLMLTAKSSDADKVNGLRLGADDYLTKPFNMDEFMARISSLIRRYTILNNPTIAKITMQFNGMTIDGVTRKVTVNEMEIELTGKEFDILYFLAANKGQIFTKKQIYSQVWGENYAYDDSNIMSFISKLRRKIEKDTNNPFYIQTIRGVGYRFNQEAAL